MFSQNFLMCEIEAVSPRVQLRVWGEATQRRCWLTDDWAARCASLPCFPEMTDAEVERVAKVLAASES